MKGLFITFEGTDASGKTTQIERLKEYLKTKDYPVLYAREPGGTAVGEAIRNILLDKKNSGLDPVTETLLYAASRAQLVREVLKPALAAGNLVICDRFLDSSVAYQGYGRELGDMVRQINAPAVGDLTPDLTFFLKADPEQMRSRRSVTEEDRMDAESLVFHRRVLEGYLHIAEAEPGRVVVIDGNRDIDTIAEEICGIMDRLLREHGLKQKACYNSAISRNEA